MKVGNDRIVTSELPFDTALRQRVVPLLPQIRARAEQVETERRLGAETLHSLRSTGLFRALVPHRYGGDERSLLCVHEALIELATACASTAWVAALFSFHALMIRWFDPRTQGEVWAAGPDALIASSVAPRGTAVRVGSHFRLDGCWPLSSGIDHAQWVMVLANEAEPDAPIRSRACVVPARDCTIHDDWHAAGLRGTGSHSITLSGVEVPEHRTETMAAVNAGTARGMGESPRAGRTWRPVLEYSFCPVAIGCALEMVRLFREHAAARRSANTGERYKDKPTAWLRLAEALGEVDLARMMLRRDVRDIETCGELPAARAEAVIARVAYGSSFIAELCSRAVARLFRGSGGHAVFAHNPLQRLFRDMHTITQHTALDFDTAREQYGRTLIENLDMEIG